MDGPANRPPYELVEDELYNAQCAGLGINQQALDAILHDLTWTISRVPTEFPRIPTSNIRRAIHDGNPRLRVWFSFDGARVILRSIERYERNENGAT